ncbi:MAG: DoxX family protein [Crocinitomicaceae bacterium]
MKEKATISGRSMIFNILFSLMNLVGVTFIVMGYHPNFEEQSGLFKLLGLGILIITIGGLIIFKGRFMMSSVSRVLVGGLFIVSGLIKANDPIGFSYKLEEYFEDGALAFRIKEWFSAPGFSLEFLMDSALLLSVIICIVEIVLGVLLIIGGKIKLAAYLSMFMMLFFTFLTWHTANCDGTAKFKDRDTYSMTDPVAEMKIEEAKTNKELKIVSQTKTELIVDEMKMPQCVDDCGCFGDAMKGSVGRSLAPSETYWKDIVLVYLILWIFVAQMKIKPNTRRENLVYVSSSLIVIAFFSWVFGWYYPIGFSLVALFGALWMLRAGGKLFGNYYGSSLFVILISLAMAVYVLSYAPMKDYRAYAVGTDLKEKMNDGVDGVYESMLVYRNTKTKETKEYSSTSEEYTASKIWEDKDWKYESMVQKAIIPTKIPSITAQFNPFVGFGDISEYELSIPAVKDALANSKIKALLIKDLGYNSNMEVPMTEYNVTDYDAESYFILDTIEIANPEITDVSIRNFIVDAKKIVVLSSQNLMNGNWSAIKNIKAINESCKKKGVPFVVICGATREEINAFRKKHGLYAPFFVNDETELKAITRSNPSILVIEKGIVKAKYPYRSIPNKENFNKKHLN